MFGRDGFTTSLWQDMPPYEPRRTLTAEKDFDVIIAGGGITGITTAMLLQEAGKKCLVVEAHNMCFGTSGGTTAHINTLLDTSYDTISNNFDKATAVNVCRAAKDAIELIKRNITKYNIDCGFEAAAAYVYSQNEKQTEELEKILTGSTEAGLLINPVSEIPVPFPFEKALRAEGQAKFSPARYVYALASAFEAGGGMIRENCAVTDIVEKDRPEVITTQGSFTCNYLIYATHIPPGVNLLHLRCTAWRSYAMAVTLHGTKAIPGLSYDLHEPYRYYRSQRENEVDYLIAGGFDHKTGDETDTARCFMELEAHVRANFDVKEIAYQWSSQYFEPADGLPYIGHLPGHSKQILVATGFGGNGMPYSHVSAAVLKSIIMEEEHPGIKIFKPGRIKPVAGFKSFISQNARVAAKLAGQLFNREQIDSLTTLAKGEGKVVKYEGTKMALYKDEQGLAHGVHPTCTHMGCSVTWNSAERSWDCPCHGARYATDGKVITGPASTDLEKIDWGK